MAPWRPGRYLCVLLGDLVNGGRFQPLGRRAANMLEEMGMEDAGYAVKLAHGDASRRRSGVIVAELVATGNLKVIHDVVLFFRRGVSNGPSAWPRMVRGAGSALALDDGLLRRLFRRSPRVSLCPMVAPQSWVRGVVASPNPRKSAVAVRRPPSGS